jgi:hypothetical protein
MKMGLKIEVPKEEIAAFAGAAHPQAGVFGSVLRDDLRPKAMWMCW